MLLLLVLLNPIITIILIWIMQTVLDKKVTKVMQTKSGFKLPLIGISTKTEQKPRLPVIFEEKSVYRSSIESTPKREFLINRSRRKLKNKFYLNLVIGFSYILFPLIISLCKKEQDKLPEEYLYVGIIFIVYHFFRYRVYDNEITLEEKKGTDYFGLFLRFVGHGIFGLLANRLIRLLPMRSYIYSVIFYYLLFSSLVYLLTNYEQLRLGIILAFTLHIFLLVWQYYKVKRFTNYKLLILRVFNFDSSTKFTFKALWKYWKYIGSFLTVVDKSLLSLHKRKILTYLLPLFVIIVVVQFILTLSLLEFGINSEENRNLIVLILSIISVLSYFVFRYIKIKQSFIGNQHHLEMLLRRIKKRPISIFSSFKGYPVRCFDNTWGYVVSKFAIISDVILMDLRGYSESRKGCRTEVNLLLNIVPVSKVTFLVGEEDLPQMKKLLNEECQNIVPSSPNYYSEQIEINTYVMVGNGKKKYPDIQGIISLLLNSISYNEKG